MSILLWGVSLLAVAVVYGFIKVASKFLVTLFWACYDFVLRYVENNIGSVRDAPQKTAA